MFQFGGLVALFGGLRPQKPPVATGLDTHSMISTKTGFGSDMDIIFQRQDRIG